MTRELLLGDIADLRAYEQERVQFLQSVIALKALRRVSVGPLLSVVFENRTTVRFQVQEMARAERLSTDEQIQIELDIYNPLIPEEGEISMTLFVELTSEEELRTWLPQLVGIESSLCLVIGSDREVVIEIEVDPGHASQLTREDLTAAVHYVRAQIPEDLRRRFLDEPVLIAAIHPAYRHESALGDLTKASLAADWESAPA